MPEDLKGIQVKIAVMEKQLELLTRGVDENEKAVEAKLSSMSDSFITMKSLTPYFVALGIPLVGTIGWVVNFLLNEVPRLVDVGANKYVVIELDKKVPHIIDEISNNKLPQLIEVPITLRTNSLVDERVPQMLPRLVDERISKVAAGAVDKLDGNLKKIVDDAMVKIVPDEVTKMRADMQRQFRDESKSLMSIAVDQRFEGIFGKQYKQNIQSIQAELDALKNGNGNSKGRPNIFDSGYVYCGKGVHQSPSSVRDLIIKQVKFRAEFVGKPLVLLSIDFLDLSSVVRSGGIFGENDGVTNYFVSAEKITSMGFEFHLGAQLNSLLNCKVHWVAIENSDKISDDAN